MCKFSTKVGQLSIQIRSKDVKNVLIYYLCAYYFTQNEQVKCIFSFTLEDYIGKDL